MTTTVYRSQADVAVWCGVVRSAVNNWMRRFDSTDTDPAGYPAPDVLIETEGARGPIRGWLPERREAWEKFAAERRIHGDRVAEGRSAAKRLRHTADQIQADVAAGRIDPDVAIRLLHDLI